jgi:hypothetical protein
VASEARGKETSKASAMIVKRIMGLIFIVLLNDRRQSNTKEREKTQKDVKERETTNGGRATLAVIP